jgi:hypothetical protein
MNFKSFLGEIEILINNASPVNEYWNKNRSKFLEYKLYENDYGHLESFRTLKNTIILFDTLYGNPDSSDN